MYLAEFVYPGTSELINDFLIAASAAAAQAFAQQHAATWGVELFSLLPATPEQIQLYRALGRIVEVELLVSR